MDLHKFGIKFFAAGADGIDILKLIPVYHRWIQQDALEDLLIDVADYSHVPAGPGVMLIAHEGNYALDETSHDRGVLYYSKRELTGELQQRLAEVARKALTAAELMRTDSELEGALKIPGNRLQFFANDRLAAPNTDAAYEQIEPSLRVFLDRLYAGAPYTLRREADPKERLSVWAQTEREVPLNTLLERLA
ncbi:MAG: hypothetical protein JOZ93_11400 [Sinobacteraceae bacterium]|nr:hypothetical protein [Nevskiaceae bacterium]MBV9913180.1 hypothetical protein [Nevskiaceae bacterium]